MDPNQNKSENKDTDAAGVKLKMSGKVFRPGLSSKAPV